MERRLIGQLTEKERVALLAINLRRQAAEQSGKVLMQALVATHADLIQMCVTEYDTFWKGVKERIPALSSPTSTVENETGEIYAMVEEQAPPANDEGSAVGAADEAPGGQSEHAAANGAADGEAGATEPQTKAGETAPVEDPGPLTPAPAGDFPTRVPPALPAYERHEDVLR